MPQHRLGAGLGHATRRLVDDRPGWATWLLLVVAMLPLAVLWALANPMFASPDEPAHIARAQGFARGDLRSPYRTDGLPVEAPSCFRFQPEVTADCADLTWGREGTEVDVATDGYPPLFHAIAAVPALASSGLTGAYLMRLWMAGVCTVVVAWAGTLVVRTARGPWPITGVALAVTPMVMFTASTVNPSGLAAALAMLLVSAALAAWRQGLATRTVIAAMFVGAAGMALTRRDGVLWLAILTVTLAPLAPLPRPLPGRLSRRQVAIGSLVLAAIGAASITWGLPVIDRYVLRRSVAGDGSSWQALGVLRLYFHQLIGQFGWLDAFIGEEAVLAAAVVCGTVVTLGTTWGPRRVRWVAVISLVMLVAAPVAFGAIRYPYLQGRYLFPIWICLMLAATIAIDAADVEPGASRRLVRVVLVTWLAVHAVGYLQNLRRYTVGRTGTWWFVRDAAWHPPTMPVWVATAALVPALGASLWAVRRLMRPSPG